MVRESVGVAFERLEQHEADCRVCRGLTTAAPDSCRTRKRLLSRVRKLQEEEPNLVVKDARDVLHVIPKGFDYTTRCGLDGDLLMPIAPDGHLPRCPQCWPA
jgi:hypothetical protein